MAGLKRKRYKFRVSPKGTIELCPSIHKTDHAKFPCCECGKASWAHAFLETPRKVRRTDVDKHEDRVPICRECYATLTPFAALEALAP